MSERNRVELVLRYFLTLMIAFGLASHGWVRSAHADDAVGVFAAVSTKEALDKISEAYQASGGKKPRLVFASTAQLARQIHQGAPADIFISADKQWMEWAFERGAIDGKSMYEIAGNTLVMAVRTETENWALPRRILTEGRFAMADPSGVPAGRYAQQALKAMGIWEQAQPKAVYAENVRLALSLVARGEVDAAIVYKSDLEVEPRVRQAFEFNPKDHTPISIMMGVTTIGTSREVNGFFNYLRSDAAAEKFAEAGFVKIKAKRILPKR